MHERQYVDYHLSRKAKVVRVANGGRNGTDVGYEEGTVGSVDEKKGCEEHNGRTVGACL